MIRVEELRLELPGFSLRLDHLQAPDGHYLVVLGPSGSGKSLLLKSLAGIVLPRQCRIFLNGREVTNLPAEERNVGYVPQGSCLFPHLSVRNNLAYALRLRRWPARQIESRVNELMQILGLERLGHRRVEQLSGGEAQKVALARALAASPGVLLLDEPLGHLDGPQRQRLRGELKDLQKRLALTVVHVTHDVEEAEALADDCAVLLGGRLLQNASLEQMRRRPVCAYVAALLRGEGGETEQLPGCGRECFLQQICPRLESGGGDRLGQ